MNKVILIGNITKDLELQVTQNNIPFCKFSIAVSRKGKEKETDFLNVVTWRGTAENCAKHLMKGSKVAVLGSIITGSYEKDGQKRYTTDIQADEVEFLSRIKEKETTNAPADYARTPIPERQASIFDIKPREAYEDLPF